MRAAYSRTDGTLADAALRHLAPDAVPVEVAGATDALAAVADGTADLAVVALEDARTGLATDVVDALVFDHDGLVVVDEVDLASNGSTRRFVAVGTEPRSSPEAPQTLLFVVTAFNRPGALAETLAAFSSRGLNVTRLDSRPLAGSIGMYGFLLEFEGSPADVVVRDALGDMLHATQTVKFLGTYPAVSRAWGHVTGRAVTGSVIRDLADVAALAERVRG